MIEQIPNMAQRRSRGRLTGDVRGYHSKDALAMTGRQSQPGRYQISPDTTPMSGYRARGDSKDAFRTRGRQSGPGRDQKWLNDTPVTEEVGAWEDRKNAFETRGRRAQLGGHQV